MKRTVKNICFVLSMLLVGIVTYIVASHACMAKGSDYYFHSHWATTISIHHLNTFFSTYKVYYPIWHFAVFILWRFGIDLAVAGGIATAGINILTYAALVYYMNMMNSSRSIRNIVTSLVLMFIQPVWIGFDYALTVGHLSPNEWRNPTTLAARLFAVIAFILLKKILDTSVFCNP